MLISNGRFPIILFIKKSHQLRDSQTLSEMYFHYSQRICGKKKTVVSHHDKCQIDQNIPENLRSDTQQPKVLKEAFLKTLVLPNKKKIKSSGKLLRCQLPTASLLFFRKPSSSWMKSKGQFT